LTVCSPAGKSDRRDRISAHESRPGAAHFLQPRRRAREPAGRLAHRTATKLQLIVNLKTAKGLGITIPHSLLFRAKVETQVWAADSIPCTRATS